MKQPYLDKYSITEKINRLSVCFFSHSADLGGAELSLLELVTELIQDHGVKCCVVLPVNGPLKKKLEEVGSSTLIANLGWWCDTNPAPKDYINSYFVSGIKSLQKFMPQLIQENPDILFSNTITIPWGALTALALGKPHVWFIHEFGQLDHKLIFYLPFHEVLKIVKESSNLIFTNSNAVKTTLFGPSPESKVLTINHNIKVPDQINLSGKNEFAKSNTLKLIITGTISEFKGQEDAVLAVNELVARGRNVELIVMGRAFQRYLDRLIGIVKDKTLKNNIHFLDFRDNPYDIVRQADIVIVCSRNEAFGRVTLEAMLMRKPVIGTNSGGTAELIKDGVNGLLYKAGDYKQLASKIEYFIDHRETVKEMGDKGYNLAAKDFTQEHYGGRVYKLLLDLLGRESPLQDSLCNLLLKTLFNPLPGDSSQMQPDSADGVISKILNKALPRGSRRRLFAKRLRTVFKLQIR